MFYDLTNPDASYYWLYDVLQMKQGELIDTYVIECHNDFEAFYDKYHSKIEKMDIDSIEIVAFQVTTSNDECSEIRKYGLRNLQWVLSNDTYLCKFLKKNNISFDIKNRMMYVGGIAYDVDYEVNRDLDVISRRKDQLNKIGHKLFYDYQINAFLFCEDIYDYSTIHEVPEFLYTLSSLNDITKEIVSKWRMMTKPYVIKYKSKLKDFAYFTFYENESDYNEDLHDNWQVLRKVLLSKAIDSIFGNSSSQIFAYMKPNVIVKPENILEYVPAEKWRKDVFKYFGKE